MEAQKVSVRMHDRGGSRGNAIRKMSMDDDTKADSISSMA